MTSDTADPDSDGLSNLVEYGLNLEPLKSDQPSLEFKLQNGIPEIVYKRGTAANLGGTTVSLEWSNNLSNWFSTGVNETVVSDDGVHQVIKVTISGTSSSNCFVRLKTQ
jgi:hypothetical protein